MEKIENEGNISVVSVINFQLKQFYVIIFASLLALIISFGLKIVLGTGLELPFITIIPIIIAATALRLIPTYRNAINTIKDHNGPVSSFIYSITSLFLAFLIYYIIALTIGCQYLIC